MTEPPTSPYPGLPSPGADEPSAAPQPQPYGQPPYPPQQPYAPAPPQPYGQPPYGQPPYGQPPYLQPAGQEGYDSPPPGYPPPGYAQPGYPQPGYPQPGEAPGTTTPVGRRRWPFLAAAVVIAAAVAVLVVWFVNRDNGSSSKGGLALPESFDGYVQLHNSEAQQQLKTWRSVAGSSPAASTLFAHAAIGAYSSSSGDTTGLLAFVVPAASIGSAANATDFLNGIQALMPAAQTFPGGSHAGTLRCGTVPIATLTMTMCAWQDPQTAGMIMNIRPALAPSGAADVANALRDSVEH
jgi:hypothetical protein